MLPIMASLLLTPSMFHQAPTPAPGVDAERVKGHVAKLSSDEFEGRGPGTRGELLTTEYISGEFRKYGL
ncbi:MAG: hypothetical protein ACKO9Z_12410 [Planctomycetota bacterium]